MAFKEALKEVQGMCEHYLILAIEMERALQRDMVLEYDDRKFGI